MKKTFSKYSVVTFLVTISTCVTFVSAQEFEPYSDFEPYSGSSGFEQYTPEPYSSFEPYTVEPLNEFEPYTGSFEPYTNDFESYAGSFEPYINSFEPYGSQFDPYGQASTYSPSCDCYTSRNTSSVTPIKWKSGTMAYPSQGGYSSGGYGGGNYGGYGAMGGGYGIQPMSIGSPRYAASPTSYSNSTYSNTSITNTEVTNIDNSIRNSFNNYDSNNITIASVPYIAPHVPVYAPVQTYPTYVAPQPTYSYTASNYVALSQIPYTGLDFPLELPLKFSPLVALTLSLTSVSMLGFVFPSRLRSVGKPINEFARDMYRACTLY